MNRSQAGRTQARLKRAALYIRVSTGMQAEEGDSLAAQQNLLNRWAREHGYQVVAEYVDAGGSARTADRREFARMLQDAKADPRPFDAILVTKWDRFARNMDDASMYKALIRRRLGIELLSVTQPLPDGAVGVLMERILDIIAEFQSLITAEHVHHTMSYLAEGGRWLGKRPFGYDLTDEGKLVPNEAEAEAVRWAFDQVARRQASVNAIAEAFATGSPFPATLARGYKWSPQAVRQMLRNEVYIGVAVWNRRYTDVVWDEGRSRKVRGFRSQEDWIRVENAHPAIVDQAAFEAVQRVLDEVGAKYARTPKGDYLFRGLVECAHCGHKFSWYAPDNGSRPKLVCSQYFRIPSAACRPMNAVRPEDLEAAVLAAADRILAGQAVDAEIVTSRRQDQSSLEAAIAQNRQRLQRLMDAYEAGVYTLEDFRTRRAAIDEEYARLQEEARAAAAGTSRAELLAALKDRLADAMATLRDPELSVTLKNAVLAQVIDRIIVDRESKNLRIRWRIDYR